MRHDIVEGGAQVTVGRLPTVVADHAAMEQILANLLSNAVKYLSRERPLCINVSAEVDGSLVRLRVADTGRGMAAEDIPRAFELFRRVGVQDTAGEGMGLAYVQALVRRLNGRLWCDSSPDYGSVFHVALPLAVVA
jgi:signal transduction histidine kinase